MLSHDSSAAPEGRQLPKSSFRGWGRWKGGGTGTCPHHLGAATPPAAIPCKLLLA